MATDEEPTEETIPGSARLMGGGDTPSRSIDDMPGVSSGEASRLAREGIRSVDELWMQAGDRRGRQEISGRTGIAANRLETWARRADLMQVRTIGPRQAALLDLAGVSSLKQLRRRQPESLLDSLKAANPTHRLLDEMPELEQVENWIVRADQTVGS